MNERESLFESRYPMLVSEGKLRGYWLIAPGVYQPPCGFSMTSDGWACRLPRWHDGPHHMEYDVETTCDRQATYISELRDGCYEESVRAKRAERALSEIAAKAKWYAENDERNPQEVDHALCVEVLALAEEALDG